MGKKIIREFESSLDALQAQIGLCRKGIDETFLIDGFAWYRKKLEAARRDLEVLGMYEQCRDALARAEELVKLGPEHDEEAEMLILNANRALTQASGTHEAMRKKLKANPNATLDDFKPDPDSCTAK
ncbi:hypothetical protein [Polaromonas hydrogenivorans]|uniref:Uncharacterized protein n=1 Tax=Polaromonas hydrogenivorans TaxID=335476 RepID=A0AAU7LNS2_9BURK